MKTALFVMTTAVIALGAFGAAAEDNPFKSPMVPAEDGDTVRITGRVCQKVIRHTPRADVTYKPGVDVEGKPVAPADLPGSRVEFSLPETVAFDLPLNPFAFIGRSDLAEQFPQAQFSLGRVDYDVASGKVMLNGQELNGDQEVALVAACRFYAEQRRTD